MRELPSGLVVKNLPSNVGDTGLIPGQGIKIPHANKQRSPHTLEPTLCNREATGLSNRAPMLRAPGADRREASTLLRRPCMLQPRPNAAKVNKHWGEEKDCRWNANAHKAINSQDTVGILVSLSLLIINISTGGRVLALGFEEEICEQHRQLLQGGTDVKKLVS